MNLTVTEAFLEHQPAIKRFINRFVHNLDTTNDIAQETFLRAFKAEQKQPIGPQVKSFLFRIAKHITLSRIEANLRWSYEHLQDEAHWIENTPEHEAIAEQTIEHYLTAVDDLSPACRKVYILYRVNGLSHKEISKRLAIAVSTVEKHVIAGSKKVSL